MLRKLRLLVHQLVESGFFFSHFRFRQYSFNSLFFQSNIAHVVHQFFVFAVELDNFFRIFVRRSHLFDQAFHALFVSFQLVGADNFAQQQANNYAAFSLFFEQFARQFQSLFFVATETLCSLTTQNVDFAVNQRSRYVDVVSFTRPSIA